MSIDIKRGSDVSMSHKILKRFRIHPGLRHVGTVGMAAYMRCNLGHLKLVNGIILVHYMLKVMVPVKRVCNASILVVVQKSGIPVYYRLNLGCVAFRDDLPTILRLANWLVI